jgi:RNase P subunit RPR2
VDDADRAQVAIERGIASALANHQQPTAWRLTCRDCEEPLMPHRQQYGICVDCQAKRELNSRLNATGH